MTSANIRLIKGGCGGIKCLLGVQRPKNTPKWPFKGSNWGKNKDYERISYKFSTIKADFQHFSCSFALAADGYGNLS